MRFKTNGYLFIDKAKREIYPCLPGIFLISLILIQIIILSNSVQGQNKEKNLLSIKIHPTGIFNASIPVSIEQMWGNNRYSFTVGGAFISHLSGHAENTYNQSGYSFSPEIRYYFQHTQEVQARTYAGIWFSYEEHQNITKDRYGDPVTGGCFGRGTGLLIGNQWFFSNRFLIDFFIGPGYISYNSSEQYNLNVTKGDFLTNLTGPKTSGTKIRMGFSVGLTF